MNILYYFWDEFTANDILDVFKKKGHTVDIDSTPINDKLNDINFAESFLSKIQSGNYDCVFSFNFYPIISKVTEAVGIKYISWCFDSPLKTLYTEAVFNSCNYIFVFDKHNVLRLKNMGVKNVFHMLLGVNTQKLNQLLGTDIHNANYQHDISFVGRTYNDSTNFYDKITDMPEYYKGFFDGIIRSQMDILGYDIASGIFTDNFVKSLDFVNFNISDEVLLDSGDMFAQIFQKKVTSIERPEILKTLSDAGNSVSHFASPKDIKIPGVHHMGYVDYDTEMPHVFRNSKINLNITLRTILSGIPLRCLDIMGAGGFLLSNYQPELAEYFVDGEEMVMYTGRQDLLDKVSYYLEHDEERISIATKGMYKIQQEFNYDIMIDKIFDITFR